MKVLSLPLSVVALWAAGAYSATLTQVTNYGTNPTGVQMWVYKPDKLQSATPPLLVAMHYCTGTAQAYYSGTDYHTLADKYGFIVIYPDAPDSGGCWDVHTAATLTHNAGGDSLGIASQVRYAITTWKVDPTRVFATGSSSGAMMTSVLMGAYPDLFAGGSAFSGVPYSCFSGASLWNSACANGQISKTGQQWGDLVRSGYPGYTGPRPKVQIWHGTADTTLYPQNFDEEIKQWTNVFGVSATPSATTSNSPLSGWTRTQYGPNFQAIRAQGVTHNLPIQAADAIAWFGLDKTPSTTSTPTPTVTPTVTPTATPTATSTSKSSTASGTTPTPTPTQAGTVAQYGQCGGKDWTGGTVCVSPYVCKYSNAYYSQCL